MRTVAAALLLAVAAASAGCQTTAPSDRGARAGFDCPNPLARPGGTRLNNCDGEGFSQ